MLDVLERSVSQAAFAIREANTNRTQHPDLVPARTLPIQQDRKAFSSRRARSEADPS